MESQSQPRTLVPLGNAQTLKVPSSSERAGAHPRIARPPSWRPVHNPAPLRGPLTALPLPLTYSSLPVLSGTRRSHLVRVAGALQLRSRALRRCGRPRDSASSLCHPAGTTQHPSRRDCCSLGQSSEQFQAARRPSLPPLPSALDPPPVSSALPTSLPFPPARLSGPLCCRADLPRLLRSKPLQRPSSLEALLHLLAVPGEEIQGFLNPPKCVPGPLGKKRPSGNHLPNWELGRSQAFLS